MSTLADKTIIQGQPVYSYQYGTTAQPYGSTVGTSLTSTSGTSISYTDHGPFNLPPLNVGVPGQEFVVALLNSALEAQGHPFRYVRFGTDIGPNANFTVIKLLDRRTDISTILYCLEQLLPAHDRLYLLITDTKGVRILTFGSSSERRRAAQLVTKNLSDSSWSGRDTYEAELDWSANVDINAIAKIILSMLEEREVVDEKNSGVVDTPAADIK